jgi:hypothetical protein
MTVKNALAYVGTAICYGNKKFFVPARACLAFSQTLWLMIVKLMVKLNDFEKTRIFRDFFLI